VKCIFALILILIIFKHPKYTIPKTCVDMCARHGKGAIEICLSENGALAKKRLGNTALVWFFVFSLLKSSGCINIFTN